MAKLPNRDSLGPLPSARSGRAVASIRTPSAPSSFRTSLAAVSALESGANRLGAGIASLGRVEEAVYNHDLAQQSFDTERRFQEFEWERRKAIDEGMRAVESGKVDGFADAWQQDYFERAKEFKASVPEPLKAHYDQRLFKSEREIYGAAKTFERTKQKEFSVTSVGDATDKVFMPRARISSPDEVGTVFADLDSLVDRNPNLTPSERGELRRQARAKIAAAHIEGMEPEKAIALLNVGLKGAPIDAVVDRTIDAESGGNPNARNPNSSAYGTGQFIESTWLSLIKEVKPELAQGRSDKELLALRADKNLSREMVKAYAEKNSAFLSDNKIEPSPGNVYLAHFLGPAGAVAVLKSNPDTPVREALTSVVGAKKADEMIAANRAVLEGKTSGSVAEWASSKMGSGPLTGTIVDELPFKQRMQLLDLANAKIADNRRSLELTTSQRKLESDDEERRVFADIYQRNPKFSLVEDVLKNPKLSREAVERVTRYYDQRNPENDRPEKLYGRGFWEFYERVHAGADSPNRITDPAEIYKHAFKDGPLTPSGADKLVQDIMGRRTPEGQAESALKSDFLRMARAQITGTNEGLSIRDPKGDEKYLQFHFAVEQAIAKARKDGTPVMSLFNADSPDYLGKTIANYKRPMKEWFNDMIHDNPDAGKAAPSATFDPAAAKSPDELVEAYRSGRVDRATAQEIAIARGWAVRRQPVSATPQVPMSR